MKLMTALAVCAALAGAGAAVAAAPPPKRPFDESRMAGRWYELARTPTSMNRGCEAGWVDWTAAGAERFHFLAGCHRGGVDGPVKQVTGQVRVIDPVSHNKVKMSVFGGLVSREYWLLDHGEDYGWLIMGTADGRYVAVMTARRRPSEQIRTQALERLAALGYEKSKLEFPPQT